MELAFLHHDYVKARSYISAKVIKPEPGCFGYYCTDSTSKAPLGDFFWYKNEHDLKDSILNGWHAAENRKHNGAYNEEVSVLKKYLEKADDFKTLFTAMPRDIFSDSSFLWCGRINELLTCEDKFAVDFRDRFRSYVIKVKSGYYDHPIDYETKHCIEKMENDFDPIKYHNRLSKVTPDHEMEELLIKFVGEGCLIALFIDEEKSKLRLHPMFEKHDIKEEELISLRHLYSSGFELKSPYYSSDMRSIEIEIGFKNDHNHSIDLFNRIFTGYGVFSSSGLTRRFIFRDEVEYFSFMKDLSSLMLMGYYATLYSSEGNSKQKGYIELIK